MFGRKKQKQQKLRNIPQHLKVRVLRKINDTYMKIGEKKLKQTDTEFRFMSGEKGKTFLIPENLDIVYCDGKYSYLYFDFDSGVLNFTKTDFPLTIGEIDELFTKNIIAGLFARIKGAIEKESLLNANVFKYIVCLALGVAVGYIANDALTPQQTVQTAKMVLSWLT